MPDFLLLMHGDGAQETSWDPYLERLQASGAFGGGSAIGGGRCIRARGEPAPLSAHLTGYIRIVAADLDEAIALAEGNPVLEAGGTVEIRELPRD